MSLSKKNIVVFASGGGGNFLALIRAQEKFNYKIGLLIVDRECGAIEKAIAGSIPYSLIEKQKFRSLFFSEIEKTIPKETELIVLAGFLPILPKEFCEKWKDRILNVHPSLLPKFGGKGMYGVRVHEAVLSSGDTETGCTVHYVDAGIDTGKIIFQKRVMVSHDETAWELGGRVHLVENEILPLAVNIALKRL